MLDRNCTWPHRCIVGVLAVSLAAAGCARSSEPDPRTPEEALACARVALGGVGADAVSSLFLTVESTPDAASVVDRPSTELIAIGPGDQFKRLTQARLAGGSLVIVITGFSRDESFGGSGIPGSVIPYTPDSTALVTARHQLARLQWIWLLRATPSVPAKLALMSASHESGPAIQMAGPDSFNLTLLLDRATCLPAAALWDRPENAGDALGGLPGEPGRMHRVRIDLGAYEMFDGFRLPTQMRWSLDGVATSEWRVRNAEVNPDLPDDFFTTSAAAP